MATQGKQLDVICLGRIAVDFYAQQIGARLEEASTFSKYIGGSSGNVAYGTAIQGLKSSMLARVGDEHMGRFLREELQRVGADTHSLITDPQHLTGLVILGIKDQETFPLIFYRENCADMALTPDDIDESYIASSRALAITGTHLSHPNTRAAVLKALEYASRHGLRTVLDIDYRPVLCGLTSLGDGETRFVESAKVTRELQEVLHHFDLIVGTEEEFHIAGGSIDALSALTNVRKATQATLGCKRGVQGCSVFEAEIAADWQQVKLHAGVRVEVLNVLGAGDAFMSGLLRGYLNDEGWDQACRYANACGALVVSRHGCAPAMPSKQELDDYLQREQEVKRPDCDERLINTTGQFAQPIGVNLAVFTDDQRRQFVTMLFQQRLKIEHDARPAQRCGARPVGKSLVSHVNGLLHLRGSALCDAAFNLPGSRVMHIDGLIAAAQAHLPTNKVTRGFHVSPSFKAVVARSPAALSAGGSVFITPLVGEPHKQAQS
ncbi:ribokinase-like domain-containing protein [Serratia symbiotica str. Tucson]|uniref:Ribokinase-like domain-containing protein n=2 Tax=Serratia symbiotica TaxID=138074 RepID=E9CP01_9GAMM|nr:ribokinase-like domain-containing protein [Serratia symbiotica str. Tucson]BBI92996.1 ribokinase-like domain-containing protein [Serratia symbiotica]